jgi:hypothetical protein
MEQRIENYLHFYLGCECKLKMVPRIGGLSGTMKLECHLLCAATAPTKKDDKVEVVLLLRPLSDMTEEELRCYVNSIYNDIYSMDVEIKELSKVQENNAVGAIVFCEDEERIGLTINIDRGIVFSSNGTELMVEQFKYTKQLLSQGFDLFNLIEAGLALDKTENI